MGGAGSGAHVEAGRGGGLEAQLRPGGEGCGDPVRGAGRVGGAQAQVVGGGAGQAGQGVGGAGHGGEGVRPVGGGPGLGLQVVGVGRAAGGGGLPGDGGIPSRHGHVRSPGQAGDRLQCGGGVGCGRGLSHLVEGDHAQVVGGVGAQAGQGVGGADDLRLEEVVRRAVDAPLDAVGCGQAAGGGAGPGQLQCVGRGGGLQAGDRGRGCGCGHDGQGGGVGGAAGPRVGQGLEAVAVDVAVGHGAVRGREGGCVQVLSQLGPGPVVLLPPETVAGCGGARGGSGPGQGHRAAGQAGRETRRCGRRLRQRCRITNGAAGRGRQPEGTCGALSEEQNAPPAVGVRHAGRQVVGASGQIGGEGGGHGRVGPGRGMGRQGIGQPSTQVQLRPGTARSLRGRSADAGTVAGTHPVTVGRVRGHVVVPPAGGVGAGVLPDHGPGAGRGVG